MESETPWWITLIVNWLPFIVLIAVWIYLSKRFQVGGPAGRKLVELYEEQLVETRKTNLVLERIAAALERRT